MSEIYFYNYYWNHVAFFLLGPLALLLLIYGFLEKKQTKKKFYIISIILLLIFIFTAKNIPTYSIQWYNKKSYPPERISDIMQSQNQQPIFLFFYADWCSSCKALEKKIQTKEIATLLNEGWICIKVDVTNFELYQEQILKEYNAYGIPAISFIDTNGNILKELTLVGSEIPLRTLLSILRQFGNYK